MKKLYRSRTNVMIAGVCSGLADYIDIDPTAVRLVFLLFLFAGLGGFWLYIILWIIMPFEPDQPGVDIEVKSKSNEQLLETEGSQKENASSSRS
jgi:phage shock protein C